MRKRSPAAPSPPSPDRPDFTPVPVRWRHDGWTPGRQLSFLIALSDTANVAAACRVVNMTPQSAYRLCNHLDAVSFRQAWDIAMDRGTRRLADEARVRALEGVVVPIFYKGEQVGERRVFNERLTMFLLRMHDPVRYGSWRDRVDSYEQLPDGNARLFREAMRRVLEDAQADAAGRPLPRREPIETVREVSADDAGEGHSPAFTKMLAMFTRALEDKQREIEALQAELGGEPPKTDDPEAGAEDGVEDGSDYGAEDRPEDGAEGDFAGDGD